MSYMNDDTDPFGIPYLEDTVTRKNDREYTIQSLKKIIDDEWELIKKLNEIKQSKKKAEEQLTQKLEKYVDADAEIKCSNYGKWTITVKKFKMSQIEKLKKDFRLVDVKIECCEVKFLGSYEDRIRIELMTEKI